MGKCADCRTREAAWEWPVMRIAHYEKDEYFVTERRITKNESIVGMYHAGLCPLCEKRLAKSAMDDTGLSAKAVLIGCGCIIPFVAAYFLSRTPNFSMPWITVLCFVLGGLLLLGGLALGGYAKFFAWKKLARQPMEKRALFLGRIIAMTFNKNLFAPMGDGLYSDYESFAKVNRWLNEDLSRKLYRDFVVSHLWKELKTGDLDKEPIDDNDKMERYLERVSYMRVIARQLLELYEHHPEGFDPSSPDGETVRRRGEELFREGGTIMMRQTYTNLAGALGWKQIESVRNLEKLWDGIGDWKA